MRTPYGYTRYDLSTVTINEEQAAMVNPIYDLYLQGKSLGGIVDALKEQGIPSPAGKPRLGTSRCRQHPLQQEICEAYLCQDDQCRILGFLYLKTEMQEENYSDISPQFTPKKRLASFWSRNRYNLRVLKFIYVSLSFS